MPAVHPPTPTTTEKGSSSYFFYISLPVHKNHGWRNLNKTRKIMCNEQQGAFCEEVFLWTLPQIVDPPHHHLVLSCAASFCCFSVALANKFKLMTSRLTYPNLPNDWLLMLCQYQHSKHLTSLYYIYVLDSCIRLSCSVNMFIWMKTTRRNLFYQLG